ncbi:response regulator [Treponema berlinense]|uniref:hybrid sensor histidine kinase/response regulator n=1 Tax=Treponema berlinense TaxID=225004 RepID=UPI003F0488F9
MENSDSLNAIDEASRYLASTLHEIRTPIQTIIGTVELLQDTSMDDEQREYIRQIQFSADVLLDLANNILDFTKIRSDQFKLESVPFNIVELTEQVVDLISIEAFNRGLEIITDIDFSIPSIICGDPVRIQQIILNLLKNAVKFTNHGYIHLELKKTGQNILFTIKDTGIGIKKEQKEKIFTNYYQGDISTYRRFGGTGLGLSISKNLVHLMNGRIGVKPNKDEGSIFWFTLPIVKNPGFENFEQKETFQAQKNSKILIVDDNQTAANSLIKILNAAGIFDIESTTQPQNTIQLILDAESQKNPFNLVFIDMIMPAMDGWHLASEIHNEKKIKNTPELYLIVPEGQMKGEAKMKMLNWFEGYLYKPLKRKKVFELLKERTDKKNNNIVELELANDDMIMTLEPVDDSAVAKNKRVLVAEDHPVNSKLIETFLRNFGADVFLTEDGQQAVEQIKQNPNIELIFMDIQMPVKNGVEATVELRKSGYKGIIIACTANNDSNDFETYKKSGINDILVKPFKSSTIRTILEKWIPIIDLPVLKSVTTLEPENSAKKTAWDKEDFLDTTGGDIASSIEILKTFAKQTNRLLKETEMAVETKDFEKLRMLGHSLKGSSGTVSAKLLAEYASRLNITAKTGDIAGCRFNLEEFKHEYVRFKKLVAKFIRSEQAVKK